MHHRHAYAADCRRPQRSAEGLSRAVAPPGSIAAGLSATGHRGQHVILQHRQQHRQAIRSSRPTANGIRRGTRSLSPSKRSTSRLQAKKFYWPGIRKDAARWTRDCEACQKSKVHRHNRAALGDFATPDNRFGHIHVDIVKMPLARDKQYCLTVIDLIQQMADRPTYGGYAR